MENHSVSNELAALYCVAGRCCYFLENKRKACRSLITAVHLDPACLEAIEFLVEKRLLTESRSAELLESLRSRHYMQPVWLTQCHKTMLLGESPLALEGPVPSAADIASPLSLVKLFERLICDGRSSEAFRCARQAYAVDPYDPRCVKVYISALVESKQVAELFYLGHELVRASPKSALSWYAVGCYYWCCGKLDNSQLFLQKAIKSDKSFVECWVLLGHVLSAQEESEQAVSAYRAAARLWPGDHRPLLFMAKELLRTNHASMALHILLTAIKSASSDNVFLLNEAAVACLKVPGSESHGLVYLRRAVDCSFGELLKTPLTVTVLKHKSHLRYEKEVIAKSTTFRLYMLFAEIGRCSVIMA